MYCTIAQVYCAMYCAQYTSVLHNPGVASVAVAMEEVEAEMMDGYSAEKLIVLSDSPFSAADSSPTSPVKLLAGRKYE